MLEQQGLFICRTQKYAFYSNVNKYLLELFKNKLCNIGADKQVTHHLSGKNMTKEFIGKNNFTKTCLVAERIVDRWQNMSFLLETALKFCLQTLYGMQVQTQPEKTWA